MVQKRIFKFSDYESPIEEKFGKQLKEEFIDFDNNYIKLINIENQKEIKLKSKKYRVDFYLEFIFNFTKTKKGILKLIIECDGHDFHEKTKEQVIKNNKRDKELQNEGYKILHFSGSEIYKSADECYLQIKNFIINDFVNQEIICSGVLI